MHCASHGLNIFKRMQDPVYSLPKRAADDFSLFTEIARSAVTVIPGS